MRLLFSLLPLALLLVGCRAETPDPTTGPDANLEADTLLTAQTTMEPTTPEGTYVEEDDRSGAFGLVEFEELADGSIQVMYEIRNLTPGLHGFHVHENGDCGPGEDGTPGGAAGGHFSPMNDPHGAPTDPASERHVGDLGNIEAGADGVAMGTLIDDRITFHGPADIRGKALLVHAEADDLTSQPSGDAGARVSCGVIVTDPVLEGDPVM